ncbi:MAG: tRNA pseudouridine(38-40) synthase TruA [Muribaculaceae bacterium]|nr:tRNA pseudouridine(38-40) synthase TruA [Bacteroides sp.]MDE6681241.1 tRNA pseudouridine(38-40) synthase TruA [Muribaculaceae bacterium]
MRYFLRISYNGAPFHGWQIQPNAVSVQQTIENALSTVLRAPVPVTGAGRTDTGVNARVMFAHFDFDGILPERHRLLQALNRLCGPAIAFYDVLLMTPDAHARFDAVSRTYKYFVSHIKNPFMNNLMWFSPSQLDYDAMNKAAEILLETEDFTSFAKLHTDVKTNICHVSEALWQPVSIAFEQPETGSSTAMTFTITADRFLRNMVRAVVGTLIDVGRNKLSIEGFADIINRKNRCAAGTSMPPHALFLWDITYPKDIFAS